ncbi:MAG: APC family permease, partial [Actinomycetota bacterium]|nr:APC family permease [Actinomycetota bacterium]
KNPGKSLPKGFLFSILTLLAVALLVWWASVGIMPWEELGAADAPIIVAIWNIAPPVVITLINIASVASLFGTLLGLMLYSSRILFAVSRDGYLPRAFGFLQPKFTSPYISVLVMGIVSIILCFFSNLSRMVSAASGSALGIYILVALSVIFLRKKERNLERPFKIKGWLFPLVPILVIAMSLLVFSSYIFSDPVTFYVFVGVAVFGVLYYLLIGKRNKRNATVMSDEKEK